MFSWRLWRGMASTDIDSFVAEREGDFWVNAGIGAVVAVVLSFVPFSPVLGGGVAGYLQGGTRKVGAKVGGVAGLIAAIPVFAILALVFGGVGLGALVEGSAAGLLVFVGIVVFGLVVTAVIAGGMGALGGYLGVVLAERSDDDTGDVDRPPEPAPEVETETVR
jgi:hypothetical protein